tara:strand:+ start:226 stop:405 length:180 start_codon:yes stop_codon:yes gene_type:complete
MRLLTTITRRRLESLIERLAQGENVTLEERIELKKYSLYVPYIAGKLNRALTIQRDNYF